MSSVFAQRCLISDSWQSWSDRRPSKVPKHICRSNLQRRGDLENDRQRWDIVAAFDETDVGCAHSCTFGELVLGEASLLA